MQLDQSSIKLEPGLCSDLLDWMRLLAFTEVSCSHAIVVVPDNDVRLYGALDAVCCLAVAAGSSTSSASVGIYFQ